MQEEGERNDKITIAVGFDGRSHDEEVSGSRLYVAGAGGT